VVEVSNIDIGELLLFVPVSIPKAKLMYIKIKFE
jgi:hypothetical protein